MEVIVPLAYPLGHAFLDFARCNDLTRALRLMHAFSNDPDRVETGLGGFRGGWFGLQGQNGPSLLNLEANCVMGPSERFLGRGFRAISAQMS